MKAGRVLLETLRAHNVEYVFGFCGETTLPLYVEWLNYPEIRHILARDERSSCFMADAYARLSFKPGVNESPSVGSTHVIPGVAEAYKASVPMVIFSTDVPLYLEKKNALTGIDQTLLFRGITKETITITKASEIPHAIRRAFRLATTGKPGPVHLRLPIDVLEEDVKEPDIYAHPDFTKYPGHRPIAELEKIKEALRLIYNSERPVVICGQGVLYSQAWDEVAEIAEFFGMPVGTTMTGKGSIAEIHPLSIGVVGARGGTGFSNKVIEDSDLIFYIGCNTDSAGTDNWRLPPQDSEKKIIHLDISEAEASNNYRTDVILIGDAKATLRTMMEIASKDITKKTRKEVWIRTIFEEYRKYSEYIRDFMESEEEPVHPLRLIRELSAILPKDVVILADPGTSAIYASAFYKVKNAGRSIIFNYALGALGYAIPASVGAICARPNACIVALTGDGSFGFTAGELETIKRIGGNIKIILFNNVSFGWIRAAFRFGYGPRYFATDFSDVDYVKIAEGFGLMAYRICGPNDIGPVLKSAFDEGPALVEVRVKPEDELVPPVPSWAKKARELGLRYVY